MLKLYYAPGSCALASHIALEEVGAEYQAIRLDFSADEQKTPEYLAINPKARVPALITDDGIITESPAILAFIAQSFPGARLAPLDDPFAFARIQEFNSYLCSTVHVAHSHGGRGYRWADDPGVIKEMARKVPETVGACFALIEREMAFSPWVMGDTYTICDAYLFTQARWLEGDDVDLEILPRVCEHRERTADRPAVKNVMAQQFD